MDYQEIIKEICELLKEFAPKGVKLEEKTEFVADLEFDSVQVMEFLPEVEDKFDIAIPLNQVENINNVAELALLVDKLMQEEN